MGWHLIQNKENYMKKKDLILAGAVLLLAGILASICTFRDVASSMRFV